MGLYTSLPCTLHDTAPHATQRSFCLCRARRRRVLSQFEDLQQCYLRLRKSGKTPAAAATLPVSPFQQGTAELAGNEPPSKRIKQEHQPQMQMPAGSTCTADPPRDSQGAEAGVSPAEPSAAVDFQVGCCHYGCITAHMCAVAECVHLVLRGRLRGFDRNTWCMPSASSFICRMLMCHKGSTMLSGW